VHRISGGETRTIVPPEVRCDLSVRLAPGQDPPTIEAALRELLQGALLDGASLEIRTGLASPSRFDPASPPLQIARGALARACGREPALLRSGGTLPILASFADRGIPAIVSGFGLPQDNFHAPNESFSLDGLELGRRSARALYEDLGADLARRA
jgi:acetylornithine deacetylase/succinyl-diaminopimelate desuccinylase-like protein